MFGLFRRGDVGTDVSVVFRLVPIRPDELDHVADPESQLILNGWSPGIVVQFQD